MSKIVVLGCGIVGKYMAIDLCQNSNYKVIAVDVNREVLEELAREHPTHPDKGGGPLHGRGSLARH